MSEAMIQAEGLGRIYSIAIRREGVLGSITNLFARKYRSLEALRDVTFAVQSGEVVGLIGPNGAGKSTTIKILTGILTPTSGSVRLMGVVPHQNRQWVGQRLGAVFGQRTQLWWDLSPLDGFQMLRQIYSIPSVVYERNLRELSEVLGLGPYLTQPVRKLSLGQRVRADLAAALLHDPAVLFLDEPMLGMDVVVKDHVRTLIRRLSTDKGVTVLLTTHDLHDLEAICPRAIILNHGQIAYDGALDGLRQRLGSPTLLRCTLSPAETDVAARLESLDWQGAVPRFDPLQRQLSLQIDPRRGSPPQIIRLLMEHFMVETLALEEPPIEELIKPFYRTETGEEV